MFEIKEKLIIVFLAFERCALNQQVFKDDYDFNKKKEPKFSVCYC